MLPLVLPAGVTSKPACCSYGIHSRVQVFESPLQRYRCRCEFTLWHDGSALHHCVYQAVAGHERKQRSYVEQYPIACEAINAMMPVLTSHVSAQPVLRQKLFQVRSALSMQLALPASLDQGFMACCAASTLRHSCCCCCCCRQPDNVLNCTHRRCVHTDSAQGACCNMGGPTGSAD